MVHEVACQQAKTLRRIPALIMAGGRSERMRLSSPTHKALIPVFGKPLIQYNLEALLAAGFYDIAVAINSEEVEIESYVLNQGRALVASVGATIECFKERVALGTVGAARGVIRGCEALLIVNVDNFTTLSLRRLVDYHFQKMSALTIACHRELCRIPFGQLVVENGEAVEYLEKPGFSLMISSGTYVLSSAAAQLIEPNRHFDITDLFREVQGRGLRIAAFEHSATWIDVNDAAALRRAEKVIAELALSGVI